MTQLCTSIEYVDQLIWSDVLAYIDIQQALKELCVPYHGEIVDSVQQNCQSSSDRVKGSECNQVLNIELHAEKTLETVLWGPTI